MDATPRTTLGRKADRGSHDRLAADAILAEALVGHVGLIDATGAPVVLPVAIAPDGDRVLIHGSTGARLFRTLAGGAPACLTVTLLDGLVLARSAFESSMDYRSLVVLGAFIEVVGEDKVRALRVLTDHLTPGRWDALRPMTAKEVAATMVLALPLAEFSVKARTGGTDEPVEDRDWPIWAGQLPVVVGTGTPIREPGVPDDVPGPLAPRALGGPGAL
ncbi:MAG: pyridoxamine 5'-phosphate oxidase family protein [Candidatus Nanopelagicales bacterium]|jgi:nitroimidazol reductase NimA-like FMN-containing flavoprotein (pyridoxamine 5'-phosphate oxidase superfamily)|nr:pyridoxamine 5'-phosphate oxidase family protein [Candidatus Nanopelagicales bacterium]